MLAKSSPAIRLSRSIKSLKQSNPFISPHSILSNSPPLIKQRLRKLRTDRPKSIPSLLEILKSDSSSNCQDLHHQPNHITKSGDLSQQTPFLPTRYRAGHESPTIAPGTVRWRAPVFKAQARAFLCKQAFNWRILRHIFQLNPTTSSSKLVGPAHLRKPLGALVRQPLNFYDGSLSLSEFQMIKRDPVPDLVRLFGGENRLSGRERRLLGLLERPEEITRSVNSYVPDQDDHRPTLGLPRYSPPTILPARVGLYANRRKPFKGKMRERERKSKVIEVGEKMAKMEIRIKTYRQEWRSVKEKSRPALPF